VQDSNRYFAENQFWRDNIDKSAVTKRWALPIGQIPYSDYQALIKANPDLASKDNEIRTKAWLTLLRSSAGEQLRTVRQRLVPDSLTPDKGSIIMPGKLYCNNPKLNIAYDEGAQAQAKGLLANANPHDLSTPEGVSWSEGFADDKVAYNGTATPEPAPTTAPHNRSRKAKK
jgi:hypothetical protein